MKYIRLKNEIIDVYSKFGFNEKYCDKHEDKFEKEFATYAINEYVIKRSNNIEDLCDEFVVKLQDKDTTWQRLAENDDCDKSLDVAKALVEFLFENGAMEDVDYEIYGAVWTDKGLIYVAKMNDKGELELL